MTRGKKERREYLVLHSQGATNIRAHSAADAVKRAFIPLGFRDGAGVIEADLVRASRDQNHGGGAFCAFIGLPGAETGGRA